MENNMGNKSWILGLPFDSQTKEEFVESAMQLLENYENITD